MPILAALALWLTVVAVSAFVVALLAKRWGHDPFGWVLLSAAMGPIIVGALIGARLGELQRAAGTERRVHGGARRGNFRILAACDGSEYSALIAREIVERHPDANVTVLVVLPKEAEPRADEYSRRDHDEAVAELNKGILAMLEDAGIPATAVVAYGVPGEEIVRHAEDEQPDLVMVGRRGAGLTKLLLGSTSDDVVRWSDRPVLVVGKTASEGRRTSLPSLV